MSDSLNFINVAFVQPCTGTQKYKAYHVRQNPLKILFMNGF